jgi:ABC-type multidrug transport system fused ATPase/permease subunit
MAAYVFANESLAMPLQWLIQQLNAIVSIKAVKNKIEVIYRDAREEDQTQDIKRPVFDDIQYIDINLEIKGTSILNGISLTIEKGKKYLVVGRNGCGKSTLFKLLKRNNDSFTGRIQLGDREIRELPFSVLSSITSYLSEDSMVFTTSVANNISLLRDVEEAEVKKAAKTAQVKIPLDRILRDSGLNISSGERRRIEIARSLISSPDILVFDEVISTLDIETAYDIEQLALSLDGKTVVFISHNFSGKLIKQYDAIIVMDSGRIVDIGNHDALIGRCEFYSHLFEIRHG